MQPAAKPRAAAMRDGYDLPACVVLWGAVMVGATTKEKREAAPWCAKQMLKAALAYRSL